MFYRRKIILRLLEELGGSVERIKLHKLLFLIAQEQSKPAYDFIPYKFGAFSYSLAADLNTMANKGIVSGCERSFYLPKGGSQTIRLQEADEATLSMVIDRFGKLSNRDLMRHTYISYPYYALNSVAAEDLLDAVQLNAVSSSVPPAPEKVLYTIGYEGRSVEAYLNELIRAQVKLLIDVRHRPQSMKYGFSKTRLSKHCLSVGISYDHVPEVGIHGQHRKALNVQSDYDALFKTYLSTLLQQPNSLNGMERIISLNERYGRVALTCFEAKCEQCHRTPLATRLSEYPEFDSNIIHL